MNILLTMIKSVFFMFVDLRNGGQVNSVFAGEGPATYEEMVEGLIVIQAVVTFLLMLIRLTW